MTARTTAAAIAPSACSRFALWNSCRKLAYSRVHGERSQLPGRFPVLLLGKEHSVKAGVPRIATQLRKHYVALSLVAIVVDGLMAAFGEGAVKRTFAGVIFGVGMAVGAVNFMAWLFP